MRTFDLAKGTLMLVVILVHMFPYYDLSRYPVLTPFLSLAQIAAYGAMAVFYIMSGYGFKERSVKATLKKTFDEMIKPYLVVMVCAAFLFPIVHFLNYRWWPNAIRETGKLVLAFLVGAKESGKTLFGYEIYSCSVAWFLLAMFTAHNVLNLILKIKNMKLQALTAVFLFFAGFALYQIDFFYYCIPDALMMVEAIYIGYIVKKYKLMNQLVNSRTVCFFLWMLAGMAVILQQNGALYENSPYFVKNLVNQCISYLLLFYGIKADRYENKAADLFRTIGIYTYWIMCIHCVELVVIPWYRWGAVMSAHPVLAFLIDGCVKAVIILSGCKMLKTISKYNYKRKMKRYAQ